MSAEESFAIWFSEYPRHVARKDALKAWLKLDPSEDQFAEILKALLIQKRTIWRTKELQFLPYPATWIRGERWEDEIHYEQPESKSDRIARENREGAIEFDKQLFGDFGNGFKPEGAE